MTIGVCLIYGLMYKAKPRIERSLCCTCIHILYMYFTKGSIDGEFFFLGGGSFSIRCMPVMQDMIVVLIYVLYLCSRFHSG